MDGSTHNVLGIVVGQTDKHFVWCKENQPKQDVVLIVSSAKPVSIGSWVKMRLNNVEFQKLGKQKVQVSDYTVIPEQYQTERYLKTVQVKLRQYLLENQQQLHNYTFGKIYNDMNINFPKGLYDITIRRVFPKPHMESVWVLANVVPVESSNQNRDQEIEITGIVAGWGTGFWYVFTSETPPGLYLTIPNVPTIGSGTWLQLTVTQEQLKGTGLLRCTKYTVIPDLHETKVENDQVSMKLECGVHAGYQNIQHPTVGWIHNINSVRFEKAGRYSIQIYRQLAYFQVQNSVENMWILGSNPKLLEESAPTHGAHRSLADQFRANQPSLEAHFGNMTLEGVQEPQQVFQQRARSKSRHRSKSRNRKKTPAPAPRSVYPQEGPAIHSNRRGEETQFHTPFPLPLQQQQPQQFQANNRHRSKSRKRNETPASHYPARNLEGPPVFLNARTQQPQIPLPLQQQQPQRARTKSRHRSKSRGRLQTPLSTSQSSLQSLQEGPSTSRRPSQDCKAMIINIVKKDSGEEMVFVWIFDKKETGQLRLSVAAEKHDLELGKTFEAMFTERNSKWSSYGPVANVREDEYNTRQNQSGMLEIQVQGKALGSPDAEHYYYPWVAHNDFGDIIDNRTKLQHHVGFLYTFWIKRSKVDRENDNYEWIVVEQDLARGGNH